MSEIDEAIKQAQKDKMLLKLNQAYLYAMNQQLLFMQNPHFGELAILFSKYGSDKGSVINFPGAFNDTFTMHPHTYSYIYEKLFYEKKLSIKNLFECGIGSNDETIPYNMTKNGIPGASLRAWRDYFPNATIYGADIDKKILFQEERIVTGYIDQKNPSEIETYFTTIAPNIKFDIMIDDGLHEFDAGVCLFENALKYLDQNGTYIIEDVFYTNIVKYYDYFSTRKDITVDYCIMSSVDLLFYNNLIIIKYTN